MPEERGLPPAGVPRAEDVHAEELEQRDADGHCRPEHDSADDDGQVARPPHEERHGDGEERVLDELQEAHEVVVEESVVERHGAERLEGEPHDERSSRDPERAGGCETRDSHLGSRDDRSDEDDDDGEIREPDVDRRRADPHAELGLVALVEEQERDRGREHQRSESVTIDEAAKARRGARAVERPGRHRATIGRSLAGSDGRGI